MEEPLHREQAFGTVHGVRMPGFGEVDAEFRSKPAGREAEAHPEEPLGASTGSRVAGAPGGMWLRSPTARSGQAAP